MPFKAFSVLVDNPQAGTAKKVSQVSVGFRLYNTTGGFSITDMVFQEGSNATGYAPGTAEMLVNTANRRRVNAVIHGAETLVLLNAGTAACGLNVQMATLEDCAAIELSQGYGGQRLSVGNVAPGDILMVNASNYSVRKNDAAAEKNGFFPYVQDGITRHNIQSDGAMRLLFDFQERNGGAGV
ncbi:MAG: hypothetical protein PHW61_01475 [Eubacteriales bacterium]|nr:hypothetical protein [Eubacteriales bacterium]